ncbi:MAG: universal stress protein A [Methylophagaceae bacterium]|jgi:universal stress protein A
MATYQHILLAIDTSEQSTKICDKAASLAKQNQATLSLCHLVKTPSSDLTYEGINNVTIEMQADLLECATRHIRTIATALKISENQQWVEFGNPSYDIVRLADEHKTDLIVIGSHGRHGLQLLLGSTANAVLHRAQCDVLAVRLNDS